MAEFGTTANSGEPYREQRAVPRYMFIATVDIKEPISEMHISGRISELSRKGCYVDILNTLPVGTNITLKVTRDQGDFAAQGRIIYVQERMGMGVAFLEVSTDQLEILDSWLAEIAG